VDFSDAILLAGTNVDNLFKLAELAIAPECWTTRSASLWGERKPK